MADTAKRQIKHITDAAVALFRKNGYENVSVNDICKAAGIARSTFYLTFSGKKDIIERMLEDVRQNRDEIFMEFISAENDFERMWLFCCRYLDIAESTGPEVTGALLRLDLMGEITVLDQIHSIDEWFVQMTRNCQQTGVMLSTEPAENLSKLGIDIAFYTTYEWCRNRGNFNLKQQVRRRAETVYSIASEWRMTEEKLNKL